MMKLPLRLVPPTTENRTVTPTRRPNADYRTREHLTQAEVERLIKAAGKDLDDARRMAEEALALHVDGLLSDGDALPEATSLEDVITTNPGLVAILVVVLNRRGAPLDAWSSWCRSAQLASTGSAGQSIRCRATPLARMPHISARSTAVRSDDQVRRPADRAEQGDEGRPTMPDLGSIRARAWYSLSHRDRVVCGYDARTAPAVCGWHVLAS